MMFVFVWVWAQFMYESVYECLYASLYERSAKPIFSESYWWVSIFVELAEWMDQGLPEDQA